jgi:RNA binding exosome subunit
MGYYGNPVAVLDMKSDQVRPLDKSDVEGKAHTSQVLLLTN